MLHSIAASEPFLTTLTQWLRQHYSEQLHHAHIWLPTRRAGSALIRSLVKEAQGGLILPRIFALGEPEEACLTLPIAPPILPKTIEGLERQLALADCITTHSQLSLHDAMQLSPSLCNLLDDIHRHQLSLSVGIERIQPEQLSEHWQHMTELLTLIGTPWQEWLWKHQRIEPIARQNKLMRHLCDYVSAHPPRHPIIIAGSTGSTPSTRQWMKAVNQLPHGHIILPHQTDAPEELAHPQHIFSAALSALGNPSPEPIGHAPQPHWSDAAFLPPALPAQQGIHSNVTYLEAKHELAEAELSSLILRMAMESEERTHLITPDATTAHHIQAQCRARYGLEIDSSFGTLLNETQAGQWLSICLSLFQPAIAAPQLIALLHHPFSGWDQTDISNLITQCLREMPESCALDALSRRLPDVMQPQWKPWKQALTHIKELSRSHQPIHFQQWCDAVESLLQLSHHHSWQEHWLPWRSMQSNLQYPATTWADLITAQLNQQKCFSTHTGHPNLHILSPMEARLLYADHVILLGLQEGAWPSHSTPQPWMSHTMRKRFGFPDESERTALEAHDLQTLLHSKRITIIHGKSKDHSPTLPSRWLEGLLLHYPQLRETGQEWQSHHQRYRLAPREPNPIAPPRPNPPIEQRPKKWAVTNAEKLLRNPYAIYCKQILHIRPLKPIGMAKPGTTYGTLMHRVAEDYTRDTNSLPKSSWADSWHQHMERHLRPYQQQPMLYHFWRQRLESAGEFLVKHDLRQHAHTRLAEQQGAADWQSDDGTTLILTAKTDRIEITTNDQWHIIDYKSSSTAISNTAVKDGSAPQLPLTAWIASIGGYNSARPTSIRFSYMQLAASSQKLEERTLSEDHIEQLAETWHGMLEYASLNASFCFLACPNPAFAPKEEHNDTAHLERRAEWIGTL